MEGISEWANLCKSRQSFSKCKNSKLRLPMKDKNKNQLFPQIILWYKKYEEIRIKPNITRKWRLQFKMADLVHIYVCRKLYYLDNLVWKQHSRWVEMHIINIPLATIIILLIIIQYLQVNITTLKVEERKENWHHVYLPSYVKRHLVFITNWFFFPSSYANCY